MEQALIAYGMSILTLFVGYFYGREFQKEKTREDRRYNTFNHPQGKDGYNFNIKHSPSSNKLTDMDFSAHGAKLSNHEMIVETNKLVRELIEKQNTILELLKNHN